MLLDVDQVPGCGLQPGLGRQGEGGGVLAGDEGRGQGQAVSIHVLIHILGLHLDVALVLAVTLHQQLVNVEVCRSVSRNMDLGSNYYSATIKQRIFQEGELIIGRHVS